MTQPWYDWSPQFSAKYPGMGMSAPFFASRPPSGAEPETELGVAFLILRWSLAWIALWAVLTLLVARPVLAWLPKSKIKGDDDVAYIGERLNCIVKGLVLATLCNRTLVLWWLRPPPRDRADFVFRFGDWYTGLGCEGWGTLFWSFEVADTVILTAIGKLKAETLAHHAVHILLARFLRRFCNASHAMYTTAAFLTAQETSGLPLNLWLLTRGRGMDDSRLVRTFFILFALVFFAYRLGGGTYGTFYFVTHRDLVLEQLDKGVMLGWHLVCYALLMVVGNAMQWAWALTAIAPKMVAMAKGRKLNGEAGAAAKKGK